MMFRPAIDPTHILSGGSSENAPAMVSSLAASRDTENFLWGTQSWKLTTSGGSVTSSVYWDPVTAIDPLPIGAMSVIGFYIHLPAGAASKITQLYITLSMDSGATKTVSKTITGAELSDGDNYFYWNMGVSITEGNLSSWGNIYRVRVAIYKTEDVIISMQIWGYTWPKGQIVFIDDAAYQTFVDAMYTTHLLPRHLPVVWALDPADMGGNGRMTWEAFDAVMRDGNGNGVTIHGYSSFTDDNSTEESCRANTIKALRAMGERGYHNIVIRGAYLQNEAAGHAGDADIFPATASWHSSSHVESWPCDEMDNIARKPLHLQTNANMDTIFNYLQYCHSLCIIYTHGVTETGAGSDLSYAKRDYFMTKVDTGIAGGWLEFVTFARLVEQMGWGWGVGSDRRRYLETTSIDGTSEKYYPPVYRKLIPPPPATP